VVITTTPQSPHRTSERDLASPDLWERSLKRSRHRRELAERSRGYRARRKAASYATAATLLATPMVPRLAGAQSGPADDDAGQVDGARRVPILLKFGSQGQAVASVQERLNAVDRAGLAVDGIYGPLTRAAVESFQRSRSLPPSGMVDTSTWRALFRATVTVVDAGTPAAAAVQAAAGEAPTPAVRPAPRAQASQRALRLAPDSDASPVSPGVPAKAETVEVPEDVSAQTPTREPAAPEAVPAPRDPRPQSRPQAPRRPAPSPGGDGCGSGRISWPVRGTITGRFGENRGDHYHAGLDIATAAGTAIRAAACGTVSSAGYAGGYGNMVCIRHSAGISTCYAHMSRIGASTGRYVRVGDVIGYVGCTGSCTGPHVHFEVRVNGRATNPLPYLNGSRSARAASSTRALRVARKAKPRRAKARRALARSRSDRSGGTVAPDHGSGSGAAVGTAPSSPPPAQSAPETQSAPEPQAQSAPTSGPSETGSGSVVSGSGTAETGSGESGSSGSGTAETGSGESGSSGSGTAETGSGESGSSGSGTAETGSGESGSSGTTASESGSAEAGSGSAEAESGSAEAGSAGSGSSSADGSAGGGSSSSESAAGESGPAASEQDGESSSAADEEPVAAQDAEAASTPTG
jgi:murein DD-endopeptidase MepM/ murein hydrolase activator NlpD